MFLALVSHLDLECDQVDIQVAFLNGDLQETIYLASPEGSNIAANKVLLLRKSLYGLRQSPRCFNKAFDKWLRDQGFVPTTADPCIYTRRNGSDFHSGNMILGSKLAPESPPLLYNPLVTIAQQVAHRAETALDDSLRQSEGLPMVLLDLTRAATLLAGWLWGASQDAHVSNLLGSLRVLLDARFTKLIRRTGAFDHG